MNDGEPEKVITLKNPRTVFFYDNNPQLDPERVNLLVIELIENIKSDKSQFFSELNSIKEHIVSSLKDDNSYKQTDLCNKLQEYIHLYCSQHNQSISNTIESKNFLVLQQFQNVINTIKSNSIENHDRTFNDLALFLGKMNNSSIKGKIGENQLENALNNMYPSDEVINTSGQTAACDFKILRKNGEPILIETKDYDRNVPKQEVEKFIRDIEVNKHNGIFLSQKSGIANKNNFQIDIIDKNVVIYIHFVEYDSQIIKVGIDIIDSISLKLTEFQKIENPDHIISNELLTQINKEYTAFATKKLEITKTCKDFYQNMEKQLNDLHFSNLENLLTPVFKQNTTLQPKNEEFQCICGFIGKSKRSLTAHQKKCTTVKNQQQQQPIIDLNNSIIM